MIKDSFSLAGTTNYQPTQTYVGIGPRDLSGENV